MAERRIVTLLNPRGHMSKHRRGRRHGRRHTKRNAMDSMGNIMKGVAKTAAAVGTGALIAAAGSFALSKTSWAPGMQDLALGSGGIVLGLAALAWGKPILAAGLMVPTGVAIERTVARATLDPRVAQLLERARTALGGTPAPGQAPTTPALPAPNPAAAGWPSYAGAGNIPGYEQVNSRFNYATPY
jgi:hypothetical protein